MLLKIFRKKSLELASMDNTDTHSSTGLKKELGVKDLTFMGVAAVIGAGVFSTIGKAAFEGGPGIAFLFLITAITCGFSALCYAEFASRIPIAGSAYTYSYIAFGEVIAWIIGWALILEYAVGNIVVAISWSSYLNNLLWGFNIHLPDWLCHNIFESKRFYYEALEQINKGVSLNTLPINIKNGYNAYLLAPTIGGLKIILNIPAFIIVCFICFLTYIGIKESKKSANFMVIFKIIVILFIIILGFFYVTPSNWTPFLPNGIGGVMAGVSAVFYAYIGFDAISTTAEECKNPKKDLPRGMFYSLIICTILYILVSLVLTGMVHYSQLNVEDPLAFVFNKLHLNKIGYIVSVSAVVATTSVLLVFQIGQPRIWMSMSRDGLLPKKFSAIHPKYRTPYFATIISGLFVGVPALFATSSSMTELTSIGTLFAFVLVCFGVLMIPKQIINQQNKKNYRMPFLNGRIIIPILTIVFIYVNLSKVQEIFNHFNNAKFDEFAFLVYFLTLIIVTILTVIKKWNAIPIIGALSCFYLMIEIPSISWLTFLGWMGIGLIIYFLYGYKKSILKI